MGCITFEPDFGAVGEGIDGCNRSPKEYHRHKFVGGSFYDARRLITADSLGV